MLPPSVTLVDHRPAGQAERAAVEHDLRVARLAGRFAPGPAARMHEQVRADRARTGLSAGSPASSRAWIAAGSALVSVRGDGAGEIVIGGEGPAPAADIAVQRQPAMAGAALALAAAAARPRRHSGTGSRPARKANRDWCRAGSGSARAGRAGSRWWCALKRGVDGRPDPAEAAAVGAVEVQRIGLRQQGAVAAEIGDVGPVRAGHESGERRRAGRGRDRARRRR